jgi:hypothetical protein
MDGQMMVEVAPHEYVSEKCCRALGLVSRAMIRNIVPEPVKVESGGIRRGAGGRFIKKPKEGNEETNG